MRLIQRKPEEALPSGFSVFEIDQWLLRASVELETNSVASGVTLSRVAYSVLGGALASKIPQARGELLVRRNGIEIEASWRSGAASWVGSWSSRHWNPAELWTPIEQHWSASEENFAFVTQYPASPKKRDQSRDQSGDQLKTQIVAVLRESDTSANLSWVNWINPDEVSAPQLRERFGSALKPLGLRFEQGRLREISASFLGIHGLRLRRSEAR